MSWGEDIPCPLFYENGLDENFTKLSWTQFVYHSYITSGK